MRPIDSNRVYRYDHVGPAATVNNIPFRRHDFQRPNHLTAPPSYSFGPDSTFHAAITPLSTCSLTSAPSDIEMWLSLKTLNSFTFLFERRGSTGASRMRLLYNMWQAQVNTFVIHCASGRHKVDYKLFYTCFSK